MNLLQNLSKITAISLAISSSLLIGCDSDNNSAELNKAVKLEEQRAKGTIIESVDITNDQIRLKAGESHQLTATGIDSNGDSKGVTNDLTWTSSDEAIATVSSKGLVTAVANSDVDQGKVIITGTTINDITVEGEISVSDVAVSSISLKQTEPKTGNIDTCFDASIKGDVTYEDSYVSLNTVKNMTFTLDDDSTAIINKDGTFYTSAKGIEKTTITSTIPSKNGNISANLIVTADANNLEGINILQGEKVQTIISLDVGERLQVNAQAKLINSDADKNYNIDKTVVWSQEDADHAGITMTGDNKGKLLALKPGVTQLKASCGGKEATATLEVKGDADLVDIQINEGEESITLPALKSIELKITANYSSDPKSLNVSEFAILSLNGSNLFEKELLNPGTDKASYKLTSIKNATGTAIISVTYDDKIESVNVVVEK